jgi:hypothetical protein
MKALASSFTLGLVSLLFASGPAFAEGQLELPQASPRAKVEQRVGVTDFSIEYSSPAVNGRKIWGALVPYDKAWRAGANASTKLTATKDFMLGTTAVKAGSYSVFVIPAEKGAWTFILNGDLNAGANHDPKKDVGKVAVTPAALPQPRGRMTYMFSDTTESTAALDLEWESMRVRVPLSVDTKTHVNAAIDSAVGEAWRPHFMSANYLYNSGDVKRAQPLVEKSIAIKPTFRNEWLNAQLLAKTGKKPQAKAAAARALKLGAGDPLFEQFFKPEIQKSVAGWK